MGVAHSLTRHTFDAVGPPLLVAGTGPLARPVLAQEVVATPSPPFAPLLTSAGMACGTALTQIAAESASMHILVPRLAFSTRHVLAEAGQGTKPHSAWNRQSKCAVKLCPEGAAVACEQI